MTEEESYQAVPKDFLKDKFLIPNNFDDPENPDHGVYLHHQLREDLFYLTYSKVLQTKSEIQMIEARSLKKDDDFFRLKSIKQCQSPDSKDDTLIRCEDWTLQFKDKKEIMYRVKTFQSDLDRFHCFVTADSFYKNFQLHFGTFRDYFLN